MEPVAPQRAVANGLRTTSWVTLGRLFNFFLYSSFLVFKVGLIIFPILDISVMIKWDDVCKEFRMVPDACKWSVYKVK